MWRSSSGPAFIAMSCAMWNSLVKATPLHHPSAIEPATHQPPGGAPVCVVHGTGLGVDVAVFTPALPRPMLPPIWKAIVDAGGMVAIRGFDMLNCVEFHVGQLSLLLRELAFSLAG